jgi:hypothetical protein
MNSSINWSMLEMGASSETSPGALGPAQGFWAQGLAAHGLCWQGLALHGLRWHGLA